MKFGNGTLTLGGGPDTNNNSNNQCVLQVGNFQSDASHVTDAYVPGGNVVVQKSSTACSDSTITPRSSIQR